MKYFNKIHRIHTLLLHRLAENFKHRYLPRNLLPEKCAQAQITFFLVAETGSITRRNAIPLFIKDYQKQS